MAGAKTLKTTAQPGTRLGGTRLAARAACALGAFAAAIHFSALRVTLAAVTAPLGPRQIASGASLIDRARGDHDCSFSMTRTTNTGQGAWRNTSSATLPKTARPKPPRPCVVSAMRSTLDA